MNFIPSHGYGKRTEVCEQHRSAYTGIDIQNFWVCLRTKEKLDTKVKRKEYRRDTVYPWYDFVADEWKYYARDKNKSDNNAYVRKYRFHIAHKQIESYNMLGMWYAVIQYDNVKYQCSEN